MQGKGCQELPKKKFSGSDILFSPEKELLLYAYKTGKFRPGKKPDQERKHLEVERSSINRHTERMNHETGKSD